MSGTKDKTASKQKSKRSSTQALAEPAGNGGARLEPAITLPGHYIAVGASPVSVTSDSVVPATSISAEWANRVQDELMNVVSGGEGQNSDMAQTVPATDDVEVLEVRARHERGFWRCGRFWPRQPVNVFVSDDPDSDNEANALEGDVVVECFISRETAERLKAEPHLVVTVLQVAEKG
ncbi:TPA: hypothetical protein O4G09_004016 [Klebsiella michiganensis]|nr:hypothetical protein [Klebsiella michiganensis]